MFEPVAMNSPSLELPSIRRDSSGTTLNDKDGLVGNVKEAASIAARRKLWTSTAICVVFMIGEVIGGYYSNSLAIFTDAAHLLSDLAGFLVSIFAIWIGTAPATAKMSFGYHRAEILGAMLSIFLIWLVTGVLVYEAILRCISTEQVDGKVMFIVAAGGIGVNLLMAYTLGHGHSHGLGGGDHGHSHDESAHSHKEHHGHSHDDSKHHDHSKHGHSHDDSKHVDVHDHSKHDHGHGHHDDHVHSPKCDSHGHEDHSEYEEPENINVRAAFIHVIGDLIQSIGVCIAGIIIWVNPEYQIADPIATFIFSILVLLTTWQLMKESVHVLMEGTPDGINIDKITSDLLKIEGVTDLHDLHVWMVSVGKMALSVHVISKSQDIAGAVLRSAQKLCRGKYGITHTTIQVESEDNLLACDDHFH